MSRAETLAGLAEAIAGHYLAYNDDLGEVGEYECHCGQVFLRAGVEDVVQLHAAHVAAVALAWLEGQMREEWGVDSFGPSKAKDEQDARKWAEALGGTLIHRRVTEWTPVEGDQP